MVDLRVPWEEVHKRIPLFCLREKIRVVVKFKALASIIVDADAGAGTPVCTITSPILRIYGEHIPDKLKLSLQRVINGDTALKMKGSGVAIKVLTIEHQTETLTGSDTKRIPLKAIKNSVVKFDIMSRLQSDVNTNYAPNL